MTKYQLYVGYLQEIPENVEFSYYDSRKKRLFVLCDEEPTGQFVLVPEELRSEMTASEKAWLNAACIAINARWMAQHEAEAAEMANAFLDAFEEELEKEAQKAQEIDDGENADCPGGEAVAR